MVELVDYDSVMTGRMGSFWLSPGPFTLMDAICHIVRTLGQPGGEASVARNGGFLVSHGHMTDLRNGPFCPSQVFR